MSDMSGQTNGPTPPDAQAKIDAFLAAVDAAMAKADVAPRERQNVIDDLRGQIAEMLAARPTQPPTAADVEAVLAELDPPESYAGEREDEPVGAGAATGAPPPRPSFARPIGQRGWWGGRPWWRRREIAAAIKHAVLWHGPREVGPFARFTPRAHEVIRLAKLEARRMRHGYVGTEHVLLGLAAESSGFAGVVLAKLGLDSDKLRAEIEHLVQPGPAPVTADYLPLTPRAMRAVDLAAHSARELGHNYIGTEHLLLGELAEGEGVAAKVLANLGVSEQRLRDEVMKAINAWAKPANDRPTPPSSASFTFWPPGTGRTLNLGPDVWTFIATGSDTAGAYAMFDLTVAPGGASPMLVHRREDKAYYVLAGRLQFQLSDRTLDAAAGAFVRVPRGTSHAVRNATAEPARAIVTTTPAGLERFLVELSQAMDDTARAAVAKRYEIEA
jgi:mannose-6-phosphate isomerase-like protein (cupin superfamily)